MKKYIRIARPDHWIKQLFIFPGTIFALLIANIDYSDYSKMIVTIVLGFLSTCFIASANYVINEWLDAEFDKYHPTKKYRAVVSEDVKESIVYSWNGIGVFSFKAGFVLRSLALGYGCTL